MQSKATTEMKTANRAILSLSLSPFRKTVLSFKKIIIFNKGKNHKIKVVLSRQLIME